MRCGITNTTKTDFVRIRGRGWISSLPPLVLFLDIRKVLCPGGRKVCSSAAGAVWGVHAACVLGWQGLPPLVMFWNIRKLLCPGGRKVWSSAAGAVWDARAVCVSGRQGLPPLVMFWKIRKLLCPGGRKDILLKRVEKGPCALMGCRGLVFCGTLLVTLLRFRPGGADGGRACAPATRCAR